MFGKVGSAPESWQVLSTLGGQENDMKILLSRSPLALLLLLMATACGGFGSGSKPSSGPSYGPSGPASGRSYGSSGSGESSAPAAERAGLATDSAPTSPQERPGLGTSFGESRYSSVTTRTFERRSSRPFAQVALHYNDAEGIRQQAWFRGVDVHELRAQTEHGGLSISLVDESGRLLQGGTAAGRTYVIGRDGQRYSIAIRNDTGGTYEVVASVDGLDVIDGRQASLGKRGYIIDPYSTLTIDGFRTSTSSVAAFRFGAVSDSYAARTSGDRNVGVIGFAFFAERGSPWTTDEIRRRETANPFPGGFSAPPPVGMVR
jgi:hypothetical protein